MAIVYWIHHKDHSDITFEGYVGVTKRPDRRHKEHIYMLENDCHENNHLSHAYKKYGDDIRYTILVEGPEDYCYDIEIQLRPNEKIGWNIAKGGFCPPDRTGYPSYWRGRKLSADHVEKVRQAAIGRPCSEETRQKIGLGNKGRKCTPEQIEKNRLSHLGQVAWNKGLKMKKGT